MNAQRLADAARKLDEIATLLTKETGAELVSSAARLVADEDFALVRFGLRNLIALVLGFKLAAESRDQERAQGLDLAHEVLVGLLEE